MTVENISWSISTKECCRPRRGLNPWPPGLQSDGASNWATEAGKMTLVFHVLMKKEMFYLKFMQVKTKVFSYYKIHIYLLITTWYALTSEFSEFLLVIHLMTFIHQETLKLSNKFVRHAFHLRFLWYFMMTCWGGKFRCHVWAASRLSLTSHSTGVHFSLNVIAVCKLLKLNGSSVFF